MGGGLGVPNGEAHRPTRVRREGTAPVFSETRVCECEHFRLTGMRIAFLHRTKAAGVPRCATVAPGQSTRRGSIDIQRPGKARTTPRRVLVVAPQPFYEDRGTPIAVRQAVEALSELGATVDLLTFPVGRDVSARGLTIHRSPNPLRIRNVPIGFSLRKVALDLGLTLPLRRLLARHDYWCIHAVEEAAFLAVALRGRSGPPVIYDMQSSLAEQMADLPLLGLPPMPSLFTAMERWLLARVDVVACSAGLAPRVRRVCPEATVREWMYPGRHAPPHADDVARVRKQLELSDDARVITYTGSFEPYQGLPLIIDAIPHVRRLVPEAVFVLVGGSRMNGRPHPVLVEHGEAIRIVPRQPRELIPAYLAQADVVLSTRAYGGNAPLKVFDYLAAGRPIVATEGPAHRRVLSDETALLVEPEPVRIAEGIVSLLRDRDRASTLAEAGLRYADRHLSWNGFLASVESLYEDATANA